MTSEQLELITSKPGYRVAASVGGGRTVVPLGNPGPAPVVERDPGDAALAASKIQKRDSGCVLVSVKSFRVRLLDTDNLAEKYHVDCCRYAGILSEDSPDKARIETSQEKVRTKAEERVEITITPLADV